MPDFVPFRGTRYRAATDISALTAPPYDVIDEEERANLEESHPTNAVRLILPQALGGGDAYSEAADTFARWRDEGVLLLDDAPRFYGYRMTFENEGETRHTVGIIGALSLDGGDHALLPHERTMPKARSDRLALLRATRANLDPIWGLSLSGGLSDLVPDGPVIATSTDGEGTRHELVAIDDPAALDAIGALVGSAPVVLADGHHRYETACAYRGEQPDTSGVGAIMTLVVELADDQLCVRAIHRVINGLGSRRLRDLLADGFVVEDAGPNTPDGVDALVDRMTDAGALGLVDDEGLALATPRPSLLDSLQHEPEVLQALDAVRFAAASDALPASAEVGHRADAGTVATLVAKGAADAAVLLRPATVEQIRAAAFAGLRMPEKTTFFAPKPRTGMVFRSLDA